MTTTLTPVVHIKDNAVFANSRDVADYFGKQHKNVLRDITEIGSKLSTTEFLPLFRTEAYFDSYGRKQLVFDMTKDGFTLLVMGYTGQKALQFKLRYIAQFNAIEARLREQQLQTRALPQDYSTALRALADVVRERERIEKKKRGVEEKLEATEKILGKYFHDVRTFCRSLPGVHLSRVKMSLYRAGYLYHRKGAYLCYRKYEHLFVERISPTDGKITVFATELGKAELLKLYNRGDLDLKSGSWGALAAQYSLTSGDHLGF